MVSADILRAAHSPLPWAVKTEAYSKPQVVCPDPEDAEWPWIVAKCEGGCPNDKTSKNNAAFIVRACNAHYQMLEALKHALADIQHGGSKSVPVIRAAIAAAEAESKSK